jgi:uncharacterized protein (TIGR02646 family)
VRHITVPPAPASLSEPAATRERARLKEFYAQPSNEKAPYPGTFSAYKHEQIRATLIAAFGGKCAYCESRYDATQPTAIEHYRPKGAVMIDGKREPPGYWWLASTWENLLPSCTDCNSPRRQDFPGGMPATAGKANAFPLPTRNPRARHEGEERRERPLLLHPYFDDPSEHLEFVWGTGNSTVDDGHVRPRRNGSGRASARGRTTIEVCALQRLGLVKLRQDHLALLMAMLQVVKDRRADVKRAPTNTRARRQFERSVEDIQTLFLHDGAPYLAMTRQVIESSFERLFGT